MDELIKLREVLQSPDGRLILDYAKNYMITLANSRNTNAEWLKGIGLLLAKLQEVPEECKRENERNENECV